MKFGRFAAAAFATAMAMGAGAIQPLLAPNAQIREARQSKTGQRKTVLRLIGEDETVHVYRMLKADTIKRVRKLQRNGFEIIDVQKPVEMIGDRLLPRGTHVIKRVRIFRTSVVSLSKTYRGRGRRERDRALRLAAA